VKNSKEKCSMDMDRRNFLKATAAISALTAVKSRAATLFKNRPNVLWIQTDEQRPDSLGCYGSEWAKTPNIDTLAANGVLFQHCITPSPICMPSRCSQLAARYPQELGIVDNNYYDQDHIFPEGTVTFPEIFATAGYQTASIGKWHTPRHPTWQYTDPFQWVPGSAYPDTFLPKNGISGPEREKRYHVIHRPAGTPLILGGTYPDDSESDSHHLTNLAIDWLKENGKQKPFLLRVSHIWPHTPSLAPKPWDTLYDPKKIKIPAKNREAMYEDRSMLDKQLSDEQGGRKLSMEDWEWIAQTYYGLCAHIDDEIGRLINWLKDQDLLDNTIIIYSSDHGRNLGEYGACEKSTFDNEVIRVPFIISWPGHLPEGEVREDICNLIDTSRTLLPLAGLEPVPEMEGRDLFHSEQPEGVYAMLDRGRKSIPEQRFAQENQGFSRIFVRTDRWRYDYQVEIRGIRTNQKMQFPSLYDLENDPEEQHNLINNPEYKPIIEQLHRQLTDWYYSSHPRRTE
jgi:choline-sulfatase